MWNCLKGLHNKYFSYFFQVMTEIYQDFQDTLLWDQITLEFSAWKSTMLLLRMTLFMNVKLDLLWTTNQSEHQPHSMLCVSPYYCSNFPRRPQSVPLLRILKSSFSEIFEKFYHLFWRYWIKTAVLSKQVGDFFQIFGGLIMP